MDSRAQGRNHASKVGGQFRRSLNQGAKRLRLEDEAQIDGEAREKAGEGSGEGAQ